MVIVYFQKNSRQNLNIKTKRIFVIMTNMKKPNYLEDPKVNKISINNLKDNSKLLINPMETWNLISAKQKHQNRKVQLLIKQMKNLF